MKNSNNAKTIAQVVTEKGSSGTTAENSKRERSNIDGC